MSWARERLRTKYFRSPPQSGSMIWRKRHKRVPHNHIFDWRQGVACHYLHFHFGIVSLLKKSDYSLTFQVQLKWTSAPKSCLMGMGEKSKGQWGYVINRTEPAPMVIRFTMATPKVSRNWARGCPIQRGLPRVRIHSTHHFRAKRGEQSEYLPSQASSRPQFLRQQIMGRFD